MMKNGENHIWLQEQIQWLVERLEKFAGIPVDLIEQQKNLVRWDIDDQITTDSPLYESVHSPQYQKMKGAELYYNNVECKIQDPTEFCCRFRTVDVLEFEERFNRFLVHLQWHKLGETNTLQAQYDKFIDSVERATKLVELNHPDFQILGSQAERFALELAKTLRSIGEEAKNAQAFKKPAEAEQKARISKGRRIIGWIVEGIIALALLVIFSYFFGLVMGILVLSALFTIFHLLGWLDAIRSLFTK